MRSASITLGLHIRLKEEVKGLSHENMVPTSASNTLGLHIRLK
jgi:hypothetical protein